MTADAQDENGGKVPGWAFRGTDRAGKNGRVLCVDDEPHVLRALRWLLHPDFEVQTAASAREGLLLLRSNDFDVVVSDQDMPDLSGAEFLREVRRMAPRAMRILLTGYADLEGMVRSVSEHEVFGFITKPWDIEKLSGQIAEAARIARSDAASASAPGRDADAGVARWHQVTTVALHGAGGVLLIDESPEVHAAVDRDCGGAARVQHAYSLADAARMLNCQPVGVLVSEARVGGLDATRLARLAKAKHPETVSVILSSPLDAAAAAALVSQGQAYRWIPKPLKPGYVRIVLDAALKRHHELLGA